MIEFIHTKKIVIFGCGNPLFGDDGFGPEVIAGLETECTLPDHVGCIDAGTAVRDYLFDILLSLKKPEGIIIVDAAQTPGRLPGEVYEIQIDDMDPKKTSDFSLHQFPTINMLKELKEKTEMDVRILAVQTTDLPGCVAPGLSAPVAAAVPKACARITAMVAGTKPARPA